ncbi:alpha-L-arabinofuranosidase C-terminus-domain-containing protein [Desarmillaria ectypa]|nr:alpha-L-arabinofuranosidase C-terminus-domain-containing protein [Desarmillaria ectypa]
MMLPCPFNFSLGNSDIVFAASFSPVLNNVASSQWHPNLITFDAGSVYLSTSYNAQKLFSRNRGDSRMRNCPGHMRGSSCYSQDQCQRCSIRPADQPSHDASGKHPGLLK